MACGLMRRITQYVARIRSDNMSTVIGEGSDNELDVDLWYPALNPDGEMEEITYEFMPQIPELQAEGPVIVLGHALSGTPIDGAMGPTHW